MGLLQVAPQPEPDTVPQKAAMASVIAFANQKGGVAKTTSTLNLAVALAEQRKRVLTVDLDPQGNLTMSQGLNPDTIERSMYDVLVHRLPLEQVIHKGEIDLAVSSIDLAGAELALSSMIGRERALERALQPMRAVRLRPDRHAAVARPVDDQRSRRLGRRHRAGPVRIPVAARPGAAREHAEHDPREPESARVDPGDPADDVRRPHAAAREAVEILQENFGDLVYKTRIRKTVRYAEAPVKGLSVLKYEPQGSAAEAYRELAKEVMNGAQARQHA